ncbi:retinoblastoma-related protein [Ananas comosus]|uniref:Retinoblastoma-related protein n=1 Tax=Ananas comosus TaxID=4615 RepID=A0A6P5EY31_ANACO|nr:retinoblastoma-related protein [Ananas comosus]
MEDAKPSISSRSGDGGAMEARFADLCKSKFELDESTMRQAIMLFSETKHILIASLSNIGSGSPEEIERFWSASVLYCVSRLNKGRAKQDNQDRSITLCQILRVFKLKMVDFFKEMPQFCLKVGHILRGIFGSDWEKRLELKELQANFVHLSLLSRYYRRAYQELFLPSNKISDQNSTCCGNEGYVSDYHRFGWLLFLALRIHAFNRFKDLVTCTNGIISILATLIIHIPVRLRNFTIQESPNFVKKSDKGVNLLASLCEKYHTSEDELRRALEKTNNLIVDILKKNPRLASEFQKDTLDFIDPDGLIYFEDLLEESSLQSSLLILEKDYDNTINTKGELDERMFVDDEDSLLGSGSLSGGAIHLSGRKRNYDALASPAKSITSPMSPPCSPASPLHGNGFSNSKMAPITPVSTAMTTAKWLRNVISPCPSRPSAGLLRFFSACDKDVTNDIVRRASIILGAIFPTTSFGERVTSTSLQSANRMDAIWAEQRKAESVKLYYRVLESMCRAESQILNGSNLTSLLCNDRFHRCMLACSAELVLATHKSVTLMFPAVLEKTGVTAFDLSKVIESFVRHEETLPRELKRHLNSLEERLLECMAWEKGSSMYNSLIVAKPGLSAEITWLGLLAEPMPSLDAIAAHPDVSHGGLPPLPFQRHERAPDQYGDPRTPKRACTEKANVLTERNSFKSPVKETLLLFSSPKSKLPPLQSVFASPTRLNPARGGETCAETGINIFFNKITKLAAIRIRSLSERLQLSQQVLERVYCLFQQILSQRTSLFFNRHIDQLILCCFYGVAKISHLSLTFKEIIFNYRKQPQCKPQVFRSVFVHWPSTSLNEKTGEEHVDIITFYNKIFIPSVKPLLVELGPSGVISKDKKTTEDKSNPDGQIPGSPRIPPFPNLPDMSPKKVSAAHNVYVSPLRSSTMDSLLSPSSKSYYACVGESTHAFQSPSKDLTAINNRLNCGRKAGGRLNFDVVSDSVVAGSLGNQNDSPASSVASAATFKARVKSEPSDS